ncbi:MAG: HEAT repeat domain-containing protein [Planctomycetales bacterium]|nr:HEAT repeat domain-containing protein [Planctomycetales bacterium]
MALPARRDRCRTIAGLLGILAAAGALAWLMGAFGVGAGLGPPPGTAGTNPEAARSSPVVMPDWTAEDDRELQVTSDRLAELEARSQDLGFQSTRASGAGNEERAEELEAQRERLDEEVRDLSKKLRDLLHKRAPGMRSRRPDEVEGLLREYDGTGDFNQRRIIHARILQSGFPAPEYARSLAARLLTGEPDSKTSDWLRLILVAKDPSPETTRLLKTLAKKARDSQIRGFAGQSLGGRADEDLRPYLRELLATESDALVRRALEYALNVSESTAKGGK